ncbi:exopolysaccharide production repressor protein [Rhizobium sp. FY34]|uniref:exopolysaccharide production repressor protein n=1 Tax=Rhizobium sp. FY34 TaxID=2562309 RepID=UPI0010C110FE|nr:exopolysaccharide production repressor protein [Rhizobium sp. FY34]
MYGPRALVSMLTVLVVFAVTTYLLNGSLATTLWHTLLCAIILQIGYFVGVLLLVRKEASERNRDLADTKSAAKSADSRLDDDMHASPAPKLNIGDR